MDDQMLKKFEESLKKNAKKQPIPLYCENNANTIQGNNMSSQSVINNVATQLRAIQKADVISYSKERGKKLVSYKKSSFVPVNLLLDEQIPQPKTTNKFETQFVLDTQIIDFIENGEALIDTQEFNSTFHQIEDDKDQISMKETAVLKENMLDSKSNVLDVENCDKPVSEMIKNVDKIRECDVNVANVEDDNLNEKSDIFSDCNEIANVSENSSDEDIDIPASYVFQPVVKSKTPSPLVFDLKKFEDFEKLALPVIEEHSNFDTVKHLINSQILGRELVFQTDTEPLFTSSSPVLEINKQLIVSKLDDVDNINKDKDSVILKDEILFSSDEESDYSYKDLPLTCALETSFHEHSKVLDKTMYVGFQTANDKSIQISIESFTKAKSLLGDVDKEDPSEASLSELVDKCDSLSKNRSSLSRVHDVHSVSNRNYSKSPAITLDFRNEDVLSLAINNFETVSNNNEKLNEEIGCDDKKDDCITDDIMPQSSKESQGTFKIPVAPSKRKFDGFKTASNKKIKLTAQAIARSKKVFHDIDLENNFDSVMENNKNVELIETEKSSKNTAVDVNIAEDILYEFDQDMPQPEDERQKERKEFVGFKTASKKDIDISRSALLKTRKIFDDIFLNEEICENNADCFTSEIKKSADKCLINKEDNGGSNIPFVGFKTARNKNIKISNEALMKSRNILENLDVASDNQNFADPLRRKNTSSQLTCATKNNNFQSFDNISERCMNDEINIINKDNGNENYQKTETFIGFRTANNKEIKISEEAYTKTKNMFNNIAADVDNNQQTIEDNDDDMMDLQTNLEIEEINKLKSEICEEDFNTEFNIASIDDPKPMFCGFKTASNKAVIISEKAMTESKKLFADLDLNNERNEKSDKEALKDEKTKPDYNINNKTTSKGQISFTGFKTASNKEVKISEEAIAKNRNFFVDLIQLDDTEVTNNSETEVKLNTYNVDGNNMDKINKKDVPTSALFQTASQKPVVISDEAIAKTRNLFKSTDNNNLSVSKKECASFKGFQTANMKPIQISAQALAKSKALFKDIEEERIENNFDDFNPTANENLGFKCFQTSTHEMDKINKKDMPTFALFQTASQKPVVISDEALTKTRNLFKSIDGDNLSVNDKECVPFKGFQTANMKPIQVSAQALAKSKALFKDIEDKIVDDNDDFNVIAKEKHVFKGFQTASKKPVTISDEALAKSNSLFKDIDNENMGPSEASKFKGFQTASNKAVSVSTEALIKSKKIFEDVGIDTVVSQKQESVKHGVFQTASQKQVSISEEAIKASKELFHDATIDKKIESVGNKENLNLNVSKTTFSFKTANNNDIEISEDASERSRKSLCDKLTTKSPERNEGKFFDTQIMNNFDTSLHTEDFFKETPERSKRSGSPILSCKAKKRKKFETPYRLQALPNPGSCKIDITELNQDSDTKFEFTENYKKSKRYTLKDLAEVERNETKKPTNLLFAKLSFDTLLDFEFAGTRNELTDTSMTVTDVKESFLSSINKKLIPDGWLNNHLRLIIWKLISYELRFPSTLLGVCTAKNVLDQLKYRYDKELYNAERPILRKILEKDYVPSKTMVLCVAAIYVDGSSVCSVSNITSNVELLLTDGWYCVKASIDKMLTKLVYDEKIKVGCKLITNGSELLNCEQGVSPWEDTSSVRLKIFGNSTRLARWDTRLGCYGNGAILTKLSNVQPEGGKVSKLRLYLCRVYPPLFIEKFEDGSTVTRSERLENIHQAKYESDRQLAMEKLCEEVEKEMSDQDSQDSESKRLFDDGSQCNVGPQITESQVKSLVERSNKRKERVIQVIQSRIQEKLEKSGLNVTRNVVPLLKVRVAGVEERGGSVRVTKGLMSIWKPNESISELIKEGTWLEVMNVVPTAIRYSEIHISAGRNSMFHQSERKRSENVLPYTKSLNRQCYHIQDLVKNPTAPTDYNEIDTVGFVIQIDPPNSNFEVSKQPFQNVYLSDSDKNIICVNFWGGLKKFGYQNVLDTGQAFACVNLQKRTGNTKKSIPHYRVTEFSYFTKSPKIVRLRNLLDELVKKFTGLDKRKFCDDCIVLKNNFSKMYNSNNDVSPYRFNNDHNLTKNNIFIDSPLYKKPVDDLNLTGLDFESTFKQDTQTSPSLLLRKKKLNEKIARLKMYGEPPPLSPMHIINKSKSALNEYKSPLISNTNVASVRNTSENSSKNVQMSPIISLNRTYVKSMNPVKLDFSNIHDKSEDLIDHFAEEFDASPPLSLD